MKVSRGDVIIVRYPFAAGSSAKVRPAVVVQCDRNNARLGNVIVAQITSNTRLVSEPTQVLLDPATPDGHLTGVQHTSTIKCENLATLAVTEIRYVIGRLSGSLIQQLNTALKEALELP